MEKGEVELLRTSFHRSQIKEECLFEPGTLLINSLLFTKLFEYLLNGY